MGTICIVLDHSGFAVGINTSGPEVCVFRLWDLQPKKTARPPYWCLGIRRRTNSNIGATLLTVAAAAQLHNLRQYRQGNLVGGDRIDMQSGGRDHII